MAAPVVPSKATQTFRSLNANQVVDWKFEKERAYCRAIKVFMMSYPEFSTSAQMYNDKYNEFVQHMEDLYSFKPRNNYTSVIRDACELLGVRLVIVVKKFTGRDQLSQPRILVNTGTQQSGHIYLDPNNDIQNGIQYSQEFPFKNFTDYRKANFPITVTLEADQWSRADEPLNGFTITSLDIHPEGFEDWHDFGRGVKLLIKIEFRSFESHLSAEDISKFHFHSIIYMIDNRLKKYRTNTANREGMSHRSGAHKSKFTYIKKKVNPLTEAAFWSTPNSLDTVMQSIQSLSIGSDTQRSGYSLSQQILPKNVSFCDLQIPYEFEDEFEDSVCLCSEWCNWNAFFHYNPIYRFLTIRHNQLFMKNTTNIADMYLFATAYFANSAGLGIQANQPIRQIPVLQLLCCANTYRKTVYEKYFGSNYTFRQDYVDARPEIQFLNGLTYNYLRYTMDVSQLSIQLHNTPFADICVETFINCEKVLNDLHTLMASVVQFVPHIDRKPWFKEVSHFSHKNYKRFLEKSYTKHETSKQAHPGYDYLFTEDIEYSTVLCKTCADLEIKSIRDRVLKKVFSDNPFNTRVVCNHFLVSINSINKFIQKTDKTLTDTDSVVARTDVYEGYRDMDAYFDRVMTAGAVLQFNVEQNELLANIGLQDVVKVFTIFQTLKIYSNFFGIQRKTIHSLLDFNRRKAYTPIQVCTQFRFIWNFERIEHKFRNLYPNEVLFAINDEIEVTFCEFYFTYWKRAAHENAPHPQSRQGYYDSAFFQYERLYYWLKNNGNSNVRFTAIMNALDTTISNINISSENIFNTYLLPSIEVLSKRYEYFAEVMDYLVYYLVKANCVMIFNITAKLIKLCHSLQVQYLAQGKLSFTMSKPGWVPMFWTLNTVLAFIDGLKVSYIVFDDELNRISDTLDQTKRLIKDIYRQFYRKLGIEWKLELAEAYNDTGTNQTDLLYIQLSIGLHFLVSFVNVFRIECNYIRKGVFRVLEHRPRPNVLHQVRFNNCLNVCIAYLKDQTAITNSNPIDTTHWRPTMFAIVGQINQKSGQQLGIVL